MFYLGMDFSSLEETEALGGVFTDKGEPRELVGLLAENGVNTARLRVWVEPYTPEGIGYGGGGSTLERMLRLARRAKDAGMALLLDLHYSDFWCDPGRQLTPRSWRGLNLDDLCRRVHDYTAEVLEAMRSEGLYPELVQVGNEITNGMLWSTGKLTENPAGGVRLGYDALSRLVNAGCRAVRESGDAKIVLHLENSGNNALWREWFDEMCARGADFDIIGASYYPFWHGTTEGLRANLTDVAERYDKDVMIVETAYAFTAEPFPGMAGGAELVISNPEKCDDGRPVPYPLTREGQRLFVRELLELAHSLPRGVGLFYWEPAWLPLPGSTWATPEALEFIGEQDKRTGNEWANQCIFDYEGAATPALYEFRNFNRALRG